MSKLHIKKGDTVYVNSGEDKGKTGRVLKVLVKEFINRVYAQLRGLIIGLKYSSADLAYNTKGQKFPSMFIEIVNTTVIRVMLPALSEIQDDREKMMYVIKTSTQLTMFVIVPIMMGLLATADNFITILLSQFYGKEARNQMCQKYVYEYIDKIEKIVEEGMEAGQIKKPHN